MNKDVRFRFCGPYGTEGEGASGETGTPRQIYRAALQLFAERDDAQLTVSELAQTAGVPRGSISNHLGNPPDLFDVVAAEMTAGLNAHLTRALSGIDDPPQHMAMALRLCLRRAPAHLPQEKTRICPCDD